jgi:DNA mismatch endonuclease (patch repair protein)
VRALHLVTRSQQKHLAPHASSASVRARMQATRTQDTSAELALRAALRERGIRYRVNYKLSGTRSRADIAFVRGRVAVFVDGCFWHGCPDHGTWPKTNEAWWRAKILENRARDISIGKRLGDSGWTVLRFWEHVDPREAAQAIMDEIERR